MNNTDINEDKSKPLNDSETTSTKSSLPVSPSSKKLQRQLSKENKGSFKSKIQTKQGI